MKVRMTGVVAALSLSLLVGFTPAMGQSVDEIERVGGGGGTPTQEEVAAQRGTEQLGVAGGMGLSMGDRLSVNYPWLLHVYLSAGGPRRGLVTLGSDVLLSDASVAVGQAEDRSAGSFTLEEGCRTQRVVVHRGALALKNWPGRSCHVAAGAHVETQGTTYGVRVGPDDWALLGVTEDSVAIHWWGGQGEADQTGACESTDGPCVQGAKAGELWKWSATDPPRRAEEEEEEVLITWYQGVDYMVSDAWRDSILKSPWFWGGVTGTGVLLCLLWLCQGDDVMGTVIINPSR